MTTAAARKRRVVIADARFTIAAGRVRRLAFKLTARGDRLLRRLHRLTAVVAVAGCDGSGPAITATRKTTIRSPRSSRRRA